MTAAAYAAVAASLRRLVDVAGEGDRVLRLPIVMYGPDGQPFEPDWSGTLADGATVAELVQFGVWYRGCKARRMLPALRALVDARSSRG